MLQSNQLFIPGGNRIQGSDGTGGELREMTLKGIWSPVLEVRDLGSEQRAVVEFEDDQVLIIRQEEETFALSNRCPHLGCGLSKGRLEGSILVCPCHDWSFDLRTGKFVNAPEIEIATYECKSDSGKILLRSKGTNS